MNTHATPPPELSALPPTPEAVLLQLLTALDATADEQRLLQLTLDAVVRLIPCCQAFAYEWEEAGGVARLRASASTDSQFPDSVTTPRRPHSGPLPSAQRAARGRVRSVCGRCDARASLIRADFAACQGRSGAEQPRIPARAHARSAASAGA